MLSYLYTLNYDDGYRPKEDEDSSSVDLGTEKDEDAAGTPPIEIQDLHLSRNDCGSLAIVEDATGQEKPSLMINVQVYAMADKFDIAELKILAKEKFTACAQGWPLPDFPSVVHEALTSTPENDHGLRNVIREILAEHVEDVCPHVSPLFPDQVVPGTDIQKQQWYDVLRNEGRFLYSILGAVIAHKAEEHSRLRVTNLELVVELQEAQAVIEQKDQRLSHSQLRYDILKSRGTRLIQEIDQREYCRHCSQRFQASFKDLDSYGEWPDAGTLRCKLCRTKHSF